jgi:uncharacterized protein YoxC
MAPGSPRPALAGRVSVAVVALVALVAVALLYRTQSNAAEIRTKTARIADSSRGINTYTDAILSLEETNRLAASILGSVEPISPPLKAIEGQSADIAAIMRSIRGSTASIDDSATSIDSSAASIRGGVRSVEVTAGQISTRLGGVSADAARILADMRLISAGVALISDDLGVTAEVVEQILADTRGIDLGTVRTKHLTACIDNGLNGGQKCAKPAGSPANGPNAAAGAATPARRAQ